MGISSYWCCAYALYHYFTTMTALFFFGIIIIVIGFILLIVFQRQRRKLGSLTGDLVYQDSTTKPGALLQAKSIPLRGKPDAIRKENDQYIPLEIKTGKTPREPYINHTMQLMAYCLLIQEHYGERPQGGIIKYPEREFKVAYTKEAEEAVRQLVKEIAAHKKAGTVFHCAHPDHQVAVS